MDGCHDELTSSCVNIIDNIDQRRCFRKVLSFVLADQYVEYNNIHYQVIRGSGMGHSHSSTTSSYTFYDRCERQNINSNMLSRWGLKSYLRYEDDIFCMFERPKLVSPFLAELNSRSSWRVEIDAVSLSSVPMLDVLIHVENGQLN